MVVKNRMGNRMPIIKVASCSFSGRAWAKSTSMPRLRSIQTTLADVAKAAGVNSSTASRILNDAPGFSASIEIRDKVHWVAKRLGYRPSPLGRALRAKKTGMIAILGLWPNFFERPQHSSQVVQAAAEVLFAGGYDVIAAMPRPRAERFRLGSLLVDGALALIPGQDDSLAELDHAGIPYVSIDGPSGPGGDSWLLDDRDAMQQLMAHLLELGHQRVAWWSGIEFSHHSLRERRETFSVSLQRAGLTDATPRLEIPEETAFLQACTAARITAIVVYGGLWAIKVVEAAKRLNLRIPEDISVATFNDEPDTAGLTTIAWPTVELGSGAARTLLERLAGKSGGVTVPVLRGTLLVRPSTARLVQ